MVRLECWLRSLAPAACAALLAWLCCALAWGTPAQAAPLSGAVGQVPPDIRAAGVLRLGTSPTYAPLEYKDPATNALIGLDIDLGNALAARLDLKPEWIEQGFEQLIVSLDTGRIDVGASGMTDIPERREKTDFVDYFATGVQLFTQAPAPAGLATAVDLCGKRVAVNRNGIFLIRTREFSETHCVAAGRPPMHLSLTDRTVDSRLQLIQGRVDAAAQGVELHSLPRRITRLRRSREIRADRDADFAGLRGFRGCQVAPGVARRDSDGGPRDGRRRQLRRDLPQVGHAVQRDPRGHDQRRGGCGERRQMTASALLAEFCAALDPATLPAETVHAVRRHMLDTLGAGLAGAAQPEPASVRSAGALLFGQGDAAPLWGRTERASPALAALANGTAAHALELDDSSGCDHSGAVVVPAVLAALASRPDATEGDLIAAVVAGYDLGRRVMEAAGGYDAHNGAGWHSTGTCGVFGAAAAVGRLWCLSAGTMRHALGIAGSFASGTWAFLADGAMTKRLHPGHAASSGLLAAGLAQAGMTGPAEVFEAPWGGFLSTYARATAEPSALTEGLGAPFRIHRSSIKPFASCRGTHAAVEAALALRGHISAEAVETVEVGVHATVLRMCGGTRIASLVDAQMSLPYAVTVAWLYGDAGLASFAQEVREAPRTIQWLRRVRVVHDAAAPSNTAARVTVTARDGAAETVRVDVPLGSWNRPLPDEALRGKFDGLAGSVLGAVRTRALGDRVMALGTSAMGYDATVHDLPALLIAATQYAEREPSA